MVIKKYITFHFKLWVVSHLPKVAESIVLVYFCCVVFTFATFLRLNFFLSFLLSCAVFILLFSTKSFTEALDINVNPDCFLNARENFFFYFFCRIVGCWFVVQVYEGKSSLFSWLFRNCAHCKFLLLLCWDCFVATTKLKL